MNDLPEGSAERQRVRRRLGGWIARSKDDEPTDVEVIVSRYNRQPDEHAAEATSEARHGER